jgi:hypothetical protein
MPVIVVGNERRFFISSPQAFSMKGSAALSVTAFLIPRSFLKKLSSLGQGL